MPTDPPTRTGVTLGLNLGPWSTSPAPDQLALVREAERLGFSVVWLAEAYGTDAVTPLAWLAAQTTTIGLGSGVMQVPGRSPAMTAMTAATLDSLSGGRFRLGLGVSGRQVSEGWHGVPFGHPVARLREYVDVVRLALSRQRLSYDGEHVQVPSPGSASKSISLAMRPERDAIPVYLAAVGPKALELTGEVADGWLSSFADSATVAEAAAVFSRVGSGRPIDLCVSCPLVVTGEDVDPLVAADPVRPYAALYVGGMGARADNVYAGIARRLGFATETETVQDHFLARRYDEACAAVPAAFIDRTSLLGTPQRIAGRMRELAAAGATTLCVTPFANTLEERISMLHGAAEALSLSGLS